MQNHDTALQPPRVASKHVALATKGESLNSIRKIQRCTRVSRRSFAL